MPELTVTETTPVEGGFSFVRSDGKCFFMFVRDDGSASLYADVVGFDLSVQDKIAAAKRWIIAYPERPSG
jgi:hypothetical protein